MIWYNRDILSEIIKFLGVKEICTMKLVNKSLLDITTKYIQNNAKKIYKKIVSKILPDKVDTYHWDSYVKYKEFIKSRQKEIKYFSPEIIYIISFSYSYEKISYYSEKYSSTLLIIIIDGYLYKTCGIDFTLDKLQFLHIGYSRMIFSNLPSIKYIFGNVNIRKLNSLETYKYYPGYGSVYISKYINIRYINTNEFISQILKITRTYPNLKKLVIDINIHEGYEIMDNISFPNIIKLTIHNIVGYCTNKSVLIFKKKFPNAKIKIIDIFLNKIRRF